nr:reverse transcriptase domain-containing protein [Tanacetum cinerariifolium]
LIYPISDSPWVSLVHCVPKKGGFTIVENEENELIPTRLVAGWRVCIDYQKLNEATRKDHFPLPFMDQMLERLAGNDYNCFLDGFLNYFQIPIDLKDKEKTTFTCLYGTFAYRRMPFGLCNAPRTFQRCMMAIFHDMIEKTMEVFMDDFSVFGNYFQTYLSHLEKMLKRFEDTNLCLNWEKSHSMVKEGRVLSHKISKEGIEIARSMTRLLEKDTPFFFYKEYVEAFQTLKRKGGFTIVENEENELIPTRLVAGWRVCIDYQKLNEATRKDHFPLPFMDQMLERLAGNDYNCFLDEEEWGIFLKETGHRPGYLRKVFYESSIEAGMTNKAMDTLDGCGMRSRTQRSNLALESFLAKRYLRVEWSVYTMLLFMMRKPLTFSRLATMDPRGTSWPKLHSQEGV